MAANIIYSSADGVFFSPLLMLIAPFWRKLSKLNSYISVSSKLALDRYTSFTQSANDRLEYSLF
ncbi:hypothetical protein A7985_13605 [Pseudoalteromonas luteoviolacea]|uniref:Uncharacterized protein n=1 Tax=Pseudoalteromonas luteoviolacea TaxID=43657 RepID=A0A1C0TQ02_9GAMM|nr:hypothetical protein A7985_13605 [Pseudoalteromonas luteoviolacea]